MSITRRAACHGTCDSAQRAKSMPPEMEVCRSDPSRGRLGASRPGEPRRPSLGVGARGDPRPRHDQVLVSGAGPLDVGEADRAGSAVADRCDHRRIGDGAAVPLALQARFLHVDRAGDVHRQEEQQIERVVLGRRAPR